jgi:hypothetical protein
MRTGTFTAKPTNQMHIRKIMGRDLLTHPDLERVHSTILIKTVYKVQYLIRFILSRSPWSRLKIRRRCTSLRVILLG